MENGVPNPVLSPVEGLFGLMRHLALKLYGRYGNLPYYYKEVVNDEQDSAREHD